MIHSNSSATPAATGLSRRLSALACGLLILICSSEALAQLMLYPTRIVFEGNQRSAQLQLINNGSESATYRISLVNRRMDEAGGFSNIDEPQPGEQFADEMLRYSPRQITIAPGAGQTVRIMVRKPANLAVGEYRSHLLFSQQPEAKGSSSIETHNDANSGIGIVLNMLVGVSIPVIVRHGNTDADVALTQLELQHPAGESLLLALQMKRSGNQSVYGDLAASFTPRGGAEQVVGRANGVAVYTPNPLRRVKMRLEPPTGLRLANGMLRVTYREQAEDGGDLLAEAVLQLP